MPDTEVVRLIQSAQLRGLEEAEPSYRRALGMLNAPHEQQHRWSVLLMLGNLTWFKGGKDEGAALIREAYDTAMRFHRPNSVAAITTGHRLAQVSFDLGHTADALALATQAEAILDRGPWATPQAVLDMIDVGTLLVLLHEWQRGQAVLKDAVRAEGFDQLPPFMRAKALSSLGSVSLHHNEIDQAIQYFDRASSEWSNHWSLTAGAHWQKAYLHMELGRLFLEQERLYRATIEFQRAEQTYELLSAPVNRARALSATADILIRLHRYKRARDLLSPSYTTLKSPPDSYLAYTAWQYTTALIELKDDAAAEHVLNEMLALYDGGHISAEDAASFAGRLGTLQKSAGRVCEAEAAILKSRALLARARPDEDWTRQELRPLEGCAEPSVAN